MLLKYLHEDKCRISDITAVITVNAEDRSLERCRFFLVLADFMGKNVFASHRMLICYIYLCSAHIYHDQDQQIFCNYSEFTFFLFLDFFRAGLDN